MNSFFSIDSVWLIVNIALWLIAIFYFWKKERSFSANILILLTYLGYSVVSLVYYHKSFPYNQGLHLYPFLFQFLMIMIALRPVSKYCGYGEMKILEPNKDVLKFFLFVWSLCALYTFFRALPEVNNGIYRILTDVYAGQEIYDDTMLGADNIGNGTSIANLPVVFSNVFADVALLLIFYYFSRFKYTKVQAVLLIIAMLGPFLHSIAVSQRGPAIDRLYSIAVSYMLLRPFFDSRIRRVARIGAVVIGVFLFFAMASITLSRFGQQDEDSAVESVYSYVGMENLNFNKYAFDNNGLRYGDRTAPMFKRMIGFPNVPHNFMERRAKYPHLKIDDGVFIGFVGDFLLDYGPIVSFVLFILFSFIFCNSTIPKNRGIEFHQLILVQFAACVCMCGGMKLFSFADLGNLKIIAVLLSFLLFRFSK